MFSNLLLLFLELLLCLGSGNGLCSFIQPVIAFGPLTINKVFIKDRQYHRRQWSRVIQQQQKRRHQELFMGEKKEYDVNDVPGYFVGFDLGTSGARVSVIEPTPTKLKPASAKHLVKEVYTGSIAWADNEYDNPTVWMDTIYQLLHEMKSSSAVPMSSIRSICFSGTSASCILAQRRKLGKADTENNMQTDLKRPDDVLEPSMTRNNGRARMYNYSVKYPDVLTLINRHSPENHTVTSATSSLAKLVSWNIEDPIDQEIFCHQADYVAAQFISYPTDNIGRVPVASDWHNCLKLGYDVRELNYPKWLLEFLEINCKISDPTSLLPNPVVSPGAPIGEIRHDVAKYLGMPVSTVIVAGTTDSNAAFIAATDGMAHPGTAVTSLGSTLAIKQVSTTYVEDSFRGVYSHRFPTTLIDPPPKDSVHENDNNAAVATWLVGGASNVGCAILRKLGFTNDELKDLSKSIDPSCDSPLSYYPLVNTGERFPTSDPYKVPVLEPVPSSRVDYLHGILQGITNVERDGYLVLGQLGSDPSTPTRVLTCGGGATNPTWIHLRQRVLQESFSSPKTTNISTSEVEMKSTSSTATSVTIPTATVHVQRAANTEASYGSAILAASLISK
jgi:D-ribulokinase